VLLVFTAATTIFFSIALTAPIGRRLSSAPSSRLAQLTSPPKAQGIVSLLSRVTRTIALPSTLNNVPTTLSRFAVRMALGLRPRSAPRLRNVSSTTWSRRVWIAVPSFAMTTSARSLTLVAAPTIPSRLAALTVTGRRPRSAPRLRYASPKPTSKAVAIARL
jgi:hypothetical protein